MGTNDCGRWSCESSIAAVCVVVGLSLVGMELDVSLLVGLSGEEQSSMTDKVVDIPILWELC